MKKVFSIIIFFILLIPITSGDIENNSPRTLYVDDDNVDGPWDGSQEYPFKEIQDAIENSNDGDMQTPIEKITGTVSSGSPAGGTIWWGKGIFPFGPKT